MNLLNIKIENFLCYNSVDIDCTKFNSVLITGNFNGNERFSNGAGKSSFFKALEYVLFNYYDSKTIDKIVRWGETVAKVTVEIEQGGKIFKIERSRNKKTAKSDLSLFEKDGDSWKSIDQKTSSETELELFKIIKMNHSTFRSTVVFAQDDIKHLSSVKSPSDKKAILKELLNLSVYSKFEKIAKDELSNEVKKLSSLRTDISKIGNPQNDIVLISKTITAFKENIDKKTNELNSLKETLIEKEMRFSHLQSSESVISQIKATNSKLEKQKSLYNEKVSRFKSLNEKMSELDKKINYDKKFLNETENEINAIKSELSSINIDNLKKESLSINDNINDLKTKIAVLESKIKENSIPDASVCQLCKQDISHDHKEKIDLEVKKFSSEKEILRNNLTSVLTNKNEIDKKISEALSLQKKINDLVSKKPDSKFIEANEENKNNINSSLISLKEEIKQLFNDINILKSEIESLNKKLLDSDENQRIALEKEISSLNQMIKTNQNEINDLLINIGINEKEIERRKNDLISLNKLKDDESLQEEIVTSWQLTAQSFGQSGIPAMITYSILDDLQIESNKFLKILNPQLELQFSIIKSKNDGSQEDTFDITYKLHGHEADYEDLSGGQKFMIALGLRLGMAVLMQKRLGVDIKFLQLDEVDEKLDIASVNALINLIRDLQSKYKIFVITHREQMKENFSNILNINYDFVNGTTATLEIN